MKTVYLIGRMRGIPLFNFPAFDAARDHLQALGWEVISPADLDRKRGFIPEALPPDYDWNNIALIGFNLDQCVRDDIDAIIKADAICTISEDLGVGGQAEVAVAKWLGKPRIDVKGNPV